MTAIEPTEITELDDATEADDTVRCRGCGNEITTRQLAISVSGGHDHTFRNPAGYSFHVACFSDAPGCRAEGVATAEATWFAGFEWNLAVCGNCTSHLGWWFVGGRRSFVGLILARVV